MSEAGPGAGAGFTLLEVLVAFVIAALALAVLFEGARDGLQAVQVAAHEQEALSRARSHLAMAGQRLTAGEQQGDDGGGFRWDLRVLPLGRVSVGRGDAATVARGPFARLSRVIVTVSWRDGGLSRAVQLESRRVTREDAP